MGLREGVFYVKQLFSPLLLYHLFALRIFISSWHICLLGIEKNESSIFFCSFWFCLLSTQSSLYLSLSLSLMSEQDHAQDPCRMALVLFSIHFFDSTITLGTRYITMYILYHSIYFILIIFAD